MNEYQGAWVGVEKNYLQNKPPPSPGERNTVSETCSLTAPCPWAAPSASPAPLAPLGALTPAQLHSSPLYFLGSALIPGLARCPRGLQTALPWRSSVRPGPSWRRSCPCSPLFSVPPPTPSSGPLLPPVFGSPASLQLPLLVLRALGSGQPPASWGAVGSALCCPLWPRSLAGPAVLPPALPLCSAPAQSGPTVPAHGPILGPTSAPPACPGAVTALGSSPFPTPQIRPSFHPGWSSCPPSPGLQRPWSCAALPSRLQPVLLLDGPQPPRASQPRAAALLVRCPLPGFRPCARPAP